MWKKTTLLPLLEKALPDEIDEADHGFGGVDRVENDAFRPEDEADDLGHILVDDAVAILDVLIEER